MKFPKVQIMIDILKGVDNTPTSKVGFDMKTATPLEKASEIHPCGTACCIGGWAMLHMANESKMEWKEWLKEFKNTDLRDIIDETEQHVPFYAATFMVLCDVDVDTAKDVTYRTCFDFRHITLEVAIECLEHLRDTGVVDYSRALEIVRHRTTT